MRSFRTIDSAWTSIIDEIDSAIANLRVHLDIAFSEGQRDPKPKEALKREFFRVIWKKMHIDHKRFSNMHELDDHYAQLHDGVNQEAESFLKKAQNRTKVIIYKIDDPISENKKEVLRKIVNLYHALNRNKFIIEQMHELPASNPCARKVQGLLLQAQMTNEALEKVDVEHQTREHVDPLLLMNNRLLQFMRESGYGQIDVEDLRSHTEYESSSDSKYTLFYEGIRQLPATGEINDAINLNVDEKGGKKQKAARLAGLIQQMEAVRLGLRDFRRDLMSSHEIRAHELQNHYEGLQAMISKIGSQDVLKEVFAAIRLLSKAQNIEKNEHDGIKQPRLLNAALAAIQVCSKQSSAEVFTLGFADHGWKKAAESINHSMIGVISATNAVTSQYQEGYRQFKQSVMLINSDVDALRHAREMMNEWHVVMEQSRVIFEAIDQLIQVLQTRLNRLNETTPQYVLRFLKRNWPAMTIGGLTAGSAGAAIAFTVMSGGTAAVILVPVGLLLGNAGGAGIGMLKDHIKPPQVQVAKVRSSEQLEVDSQHVFSTRTILERVFGQEFLARHVNDIRDVGENITHDPDHDDGQLDYLNLSWSSSGSNGGEVVVDYGMLEAELFPDVAASVSNSSGDGVTVFRI